MAGFYTSQSLSVDVGDDPMKEGLLLLLADQRALLEIAVAGVDEEQARTRTTVSELTLGGIVKHLAHGELDTADMIAHPDPDAQFDLSRLDDEYTLGESETWAQALDEYAAATTRFEEVIAAAPLDAMIPQPIAPWAPERVWWSVHRLLANRIRETAHHCGHADIIREALDGQTTMGVLSSGLSF